jgi:predicted amidohydrolase
VRLRTVLAQVPVCEHVERNLETIGRAIEFARREKADMLLTPEGSLSGYTLKVDRHAVDRALREVERRAKAARVGLALGTCRIEDDELCYNELRFYEPDGTFRGFHAKNLRCGTLTEPPEGEVVHYAARPPQTFTFKGLRIGGLICNDLWANPMCTPMPDTHLTQQLVRMGAKIIFHAVNGGRDASEFSQVVFKRFHECNLRARAAAGKVWIATADNSWPHDIPNSCYSGILNPQGQWVLKMPDQGEQLAVCEIDVAG